MEVKPNDLTIVILSFNRHKFLKRTISYYLNFDYNILIVDGTKTKLDSELLKNNKVHYIHSVSHYYERYVIASRNIKSKYAIVAGAVTGGGLTVIANAPNPAGQSILGRFFHGGVNPAKLAICALIPTIIMGICFMAIKTV